MEWILVAIVAVACTVAVGLSYHFLVGPKEQAEGAAVEVAKQKAKAEALAVTAKAIEKVVEGQHAAIDARTAELKLCDPVDVANELIEKRMRKDSKS